MTRIHGVQPSSSINLNLSVLLLGIQRVESKTFSNGIAAFLLFETRFRCLTVSALHLPESMTKRKNQSFSSANIIELARFVVFVSKNLSWSPFLIYFAANLLY